jgi:molybdopterin-guanine dinucleotide biosynthesis protein A
MPFVPPALLARLAAGPEAAVRMGEEVQPFPARYEPAALPALREAVERGAPVRATVAGLSAIAWDDAAALRSVNTPDELAAARVELA